MIDLHLHSNYSDGSCSLEELICLLRDKEVKYAALTDHDTVKGVEKFIELAKIAGIKAITGVEITAFIGDSQVHILGYAFDILNPDLIETLRKQSTSRIDRAKEIIKKANHLGFQINFEEVADITGNKDGNIGKPHLGKILIKNNREKLKEILNQEPSIDLIMKNLFDRKQLLYAESNKISYNEAINLIKNAGGYAILAHPNYRVQHEAFLINLPKMVDAGLDGMETFFSASSEKETKAYLELADKYGLFITTGSDFHGEDNRKIGKVNFYDFDRDMIMNNTKKYLFEKTKKGGSIV